MWVSQSGSAHEHMHAFNHFSQPFLPAAIEARRGLPLQIDDLATVVFHFGGGFGGLSG